MNDEKGVRRTLWVSKETDSLMEEARLKLSLSKSGFYRYAVVRLLEGMSISSAKVKTNKTEEA